MALRWRQGEKGRHAQAPKPSGLEWPRAEEDAPPALYPGPHR